MANLFDWSCLEAEKRRGGRFDQSSGSSLSRRFQIAERCPFFDEADAWGYLRAYNNH